MVFYLSPRLFKCTHKRKKIIEKRHRICFKKKKKYKKLINEECVLLRENKIVGTKVKQKEGKIRNSNRDAVASECLSINLKRKAKSKKKHNKI